MRMEGNFGVFSGGLHDSGEVGFEDETGGIPADHSLLEHDLVEPGLGPEALMSMKPSERDALYDRILSEGREVRPMDVIMRQRHPAAFRHSRNIS